MCQYGVAGTERLPMAGLADSCSAGIDSMVPGNPLHCQPVGSRMPGQAAAIGKIEDDPQSFARFGNPPLYLCHWPPEMFCADTDDATAIHNIIRAVENAAFRQQPAVSIARQNVVGSAADDTRFQAANRALVEDASECAGGKNIAGNIEGGIGRDQLSA